MEKYDLILTRSELSVLEGLVDLLDVFNIFTKYIQGNSYPTMNTVLLFYTEIEDRLKYIAKHSLEESISNAAELLLLKKLPNRIEIVNEFVAASLLDPRLQHLDIIEKWLTKNGNIFCSYLSIVSSLFYFISFHYSVKLTSKFDYDTVNQQTLIH